MRRSHTILVAFDVEPTWTGPEAMEKLTSAFLDSGALNPADPDTIVESWHFAEDDGPEPASDVMSAVFCRKGSQYRASETLRAAGLA